MAEQPLIPSTSEANETDAHEESERSSVSQSLRSVVPILCFRRGILFGLLSGVFMAVQIISLDYFKDRVGPWQSLFFRSLILPIALLKVEWEPRESQDIGTLLVFLIVGITEVLFITFTALAIQFMPVGDVTAIAQNLPIPSAVAALIFLGEKMDIFDLPLVIVNGIGLVFVAKPSFLGPGDEAAQHHAVGVVFALLGLTAVVIFSLLLRFLAKRNADDPYLGAALCGLSGIVISTLFTSITSSWNFPDEYFDWIIVFVLAFAALGTIYCYIRSLETETVLCTAVLLTICIPISFLYGVIISGHVDWLIASGAILICGSTIALYIKELWKQHHSERVI